ncbi:hypothetical protein HA402_015724 [Bradysia odoriphaga]|nr:hypothetical protein HA402_015724 [Bradysia odoriphaga]
MKLYLFIIGIFVSIALCSCNDKIAVTPVKTNHCSCTKPQPVRPRFVCYNIDQLLPFCPPCVEPCFATCPCIFPDEAQTIITPQPATERPPYCPKCEVNVFCIVEACFGGPKPCTAEYVQRLVNEK